MKIIDIEQDTPEWLELRKGKITGSKLKDIVVFRGNGRKLGFYQLLADKLALPPDGEDARDRGHRLEIEGVEKFEKLTGKKVNKKPGMWLSDDYDDMAISPDGVIQNKQGIFTEAVEVKCLGSARHLQALIEDCIPDDFKLQKLQYFIVNPDLETLHFVFYDDLNTKYPLHVIECHRTDLEDDIQYYKDYETRTLNELNELVERLAF